MSAEPWYVAAFGSGYRAAYPHRDLAAARREVGHMLSRGIGGRVLDLCCGFGRHSLAFAEAGVDVVGVDLSAALLAEATELPGAERLAGRLVRADARALPFRADVFDAAVLLFSSFGYFGERGDARVLEELARAVRPGGCVLLDLLNPARVRTTLVPESRATRGGAAVLERRALSDDGRRVTKAVRIEDSGGGVREWTEDVRLYGTDELREVAAARGMQVENTWGDFDGRPFGDRSERQIALLRIGGRGRA